MKKLILIASLSALALPFTAAAHQHSGGHDAHGAHGAYKAASKDEPESVRAFRAINDGMHEGMDIEYTGDADVDFMKGMIPHHQGAVAMAQVVLEHGKDEQVRKLAQEVIEAQQAEIEMMRNWLKERGH